MSASTPLTTPDGRYPVVRGRLWRCTNPELPEAQRQAWMMSQSPDWRAVQACPPPGAVDYAGKQAAVWP
ncbi:hypothetical protein FEI13_03040 [Halomonas urmiana]|uniref:Uncharacterized protein n=1 Tax=Halomonas urmiana TaxID=490901 RepID=A0A5R8MLP7_9GAMM|nr:hypothetical protein [Halomonas urmiana]TLF53090.1 hypothetical protein FEI13_03040 [Halomonas urmiana]